ncbi:MULTISPECIES: hypothetical protein [Yersiniaceae]|jgi:hypothetical protein|nr:MULTISPECIES: hypothetical protein [Yersiniaceae]MDV5140599.1 hypothetical protein [Chimaeribacter arupi]WKZ92493.1 hypothetical protein P0E69_00560 [Chimaeribacter arupi]
MKTTRKVFITLFVALVMQTAAEEGWQINVSNVQLQLNLFQPR